MPGLTGPVQNRQSCEVLGACCCRVPPGQAGWRQGRKCLFELEMQLLPRGSVRVCLTKPLNLQDSQSRGQGATVAGVPVHLAAGSLGR